MEIKIQIPDDCELIRNGNTYTLPFKTTDFIPEPFIPTL